MKFEKNNYKKITLNIPLAEYEEIQKHITNNNYLNIADYVREAIRLRNQELKRIE